MMISVMTRAIGTFGVMMNAEKRIREKTACKDNISVAVIGASGMLGSMVLDVLSREQGLKLIATVRSIDIMKQMRIHYSDVDWWLLDADMTDMAKLTDILRDADWIINAVGLTKPYIHDDNPDEIEQAILVNSLFPHKLAKAAAIQGARILQIATDCVYSGEKGSYNENDSHDASDVYGKTKSLGEAFLPNVHNLRCSILGPELKTFVFLYEWFRHQPQNAQVNGYTNHRWNGISTLHFAKICLGIIKGKIKLGHLQHVIPTGTVSKFELLSIFAKAFHRPDLTINPVNANTCIDRTLTTENEIMNQTLWKAAGYSSPPPIPEMIKEMALSTSTFSLSVR